MVLSLYVARVFCGRAVSNIPLWSGLGMLALYVCYCFLGIQFNNGISGMAELIIAALVATSVGSFVLGGRMPGLRLISRCGSLQQRNGAQRHYMRPVPLHYLWVLVVVSIIFYWLLTQGQPLRLLTDGVGLKFERLQGIAEKSPLLLNLDALVLAMTLIGLAWSILSYRDDLKSKLTLGFCLVLIFLYVLSTGSRTPLIAVILQIVPAVGVARKRSRHMAWISRKKWFFVWALLASMIFMIITTGSRMQFEELNVDVFYYYFGVRDFGIVTPLLQSGDAAAFFVATAITYAASTFNNVIIRFQELDAITLSMGYKFLFFYISAAQILMPGALPEGVAEWRDLATLNKDHLESISQAAGQWSTPYGDLIWDFGVGGTFAIVALLGLLAGLITADARKNPIFNNILWHVMIVGFSLSPLVNSFLSLYVHYVVAILLMITLSPPQRFIDANPRLRQDSTMARSQ